MHVQFDNKKNVLWQGDLTGISAETKKLPERWAVRALIHEGSFRGTHVSFGSCTSAGAFDVRVRRIDGATLWPMLIGTEYDEASGGTAPGFLSDASALYPSDRVRALHCITCTRGDVSVR